MDLELRRHLLERRYLVVLLLLLLLLVELLHLLRIVIDWSILVVGRRERCNRLVVWDVGHTLREPSRRCWGRERLCVVAIVHGSVAVEVLAVAIVVAVPSRFTHCGMCWLGIELIELLMKKRRRQLNLYNGVIQCLDSLKLYWFYFFCLYESFFLNSN